MYRWIKVGSKFFANDLKDCQSKADSPKQKVFSYKCFLDSRKDGLGNRKCNSFHKYTFFIQNPSSLMKNGDTLMITKILGHRINASLYNGNYYLQSLLSVEVELCEPDKNLPPQEKTFEEQVKEDGFNFYDSSVEDEDLPF